MAFKTRSLRYLGGISGHGVVQRDGKTVAPVQFDLDGYFRPAVGVTGSGEIKLPPETLEGLFGRSDLQLLTDSGLRLSLRFSDSKLPPASDFVGVEVTGPASFTPEDWAA
jgi:hypothetical protein